VSDVMIGSPTVRKLVKIVRDQAYKELFCFLTFLEYDKKKFRWKVLEFHGLYF
jgi:hypothetical protein